MNLILLNEILMHLAAAFCIGLVVMLFALFGSLVLVTGRPISRLPGGLYIAASIFPGLLVAVCAYPLLPTSTYALLCVIWSLVALILASVTALSLWLNTVKDYIKRLKGVRGERQVARRLAKLGYQARHDCHVGTKGGRIAQVDHLALVGNQIVVIETKNYLGDIMASDGDGKWTLLKEDGSTGTAIPNPLGQNAVHVEAVRQAFGFEPLGLVVMTELSTFVRDVPRGVVQLRKLGETLESIAGRRGDRAVADATWDRICAYLDDPASPTGTDHASYLTWLRVGQGRPEKPTPSKDGDPPRLCGKCGSTDVWLGHGHSHYWGCRTCGKLTHIPPHASDIPGELDPDKAFSKRRAVKASHVVPEPVAEFESFDVALAATRWNGRRKANETSSADLH